MAFTLRAARMSSNWAVTPIGPSSKVRATHFIRLQSAPPAGGALGVDEALGVGETLGVGDALGAGTGRWLTLAPATVVACAGRSPVRAETSVDGTGARVLSHPHKASPITTAAERRTTTVPRRHVMNAPSAHAPIVDLFDPTV
nr:hypothetical protein GCM10010200_014160 [Actinomadura rugatobispora]